MSSLQKEKDLDKRLQVNKLDPYKTELRREVIARRRELTRLYVLNREKTQEKRLLKTVNDNVVTIDTNKARSNTDVLRLAIRDLGWREADLRSASCHSLLNNKIPIKFPFQRRDHNCDITWHAISFYDQSEIYSGKVNKFPGSIDIFRKVNTFRWLEFMKTLFPDEYDFFPRTWLLPYHFNEFANAVRSASEKKPKHKPMYIVKPSEGSQGQGIYLLEDPLSYTNYNNRSHVVQEYLGNIFLIDKYKFDLRIYVVLKSLDPLVFYICREGLARFSTVPYEQPTNKNMHETFMHLTNYSLNKKSTDFKISQKDDEGSKRKMSSVFKIMDNLGHDVEALWAKIEHLVTKTLIAVVGELKVEYQAAIPAGKPGPTCFQVLGFDIILLNTLQPMLLEVNSNPSLSITEEHETPDGCVEYVISAKDEEVKRTLLRDTLLLVAPKHKCARRRQRRHRRRSVRNNEEEDMDIDNPDITQNSTRILRRETYSSYKQLRGDKLDREKTVLYTSENSKDNRRVRKETCRVFIDGEGEVLYSVRPSGDTLLQRRSKMSSLKNWVSRMMGRKQSVESDMETNDRLPSVFSKNGQQSEDITIQEEEDSGRHLSQSIPFEAESSDDNDEDETDNEEEESCLKEIFPALYGENFKNERIVERLADIFITCLGVKECLRLSPSMFRLFARKCHLNRKGITNAEIDILYIDMQRKWEYMNPDRTSGLNFFAFVSGCCKIASETFSGKTSRVQINNFIDHCQNFLKIPTDLDKEPAKGAHVYRKSLSGSKEKGSLKLPLADGKQKIRSSEARHVLLDVSYNDRNLPVLQLRHRNVFHMLQSIKK